MNIFKWLFSDFNDPNRDILEVGQKYKCGNHFWIKTYVRMLEGYSTKYSNRYGYKYKGEESAEYYYNAYIKFYESPGYVEYDRYVIVEKILGDTITVSLWGGNDSESSRFKAPDGVLFTAHPSIFKQWQEEREWLKLHINDDKYFSEYVKFEE